ncbi:hypothetical protein [Mesorhizobium australafricanum]|uniref:Uncharacterized protein n=1 Tax=Mesorhizobium australafricanum TaxID=3072311 RepID=A0ABU4X2J6_9HYPH|nr:hypothetical protein [Mesorhizobium sp. VK3E]MDX8442173.1 hypothetical protein [Mesorhizobium sp. VK3E]
MTYRSMPSSFEVLARSAARPVSEIDLEEALAIVREQIALLDLDLTGLTVVVGAATGYRAIAATAAALANAGRVIALTRDSQRRPGVPTAGYATLAFAKYAKVSDRVEVTNRIDSRNWQNVDLLANCLQIGPISRSLAELLPSHAVISLMAEPWELRPGVVDFEGCDDAGIKVVAPNLGHPAISVLADFARLCCVLLDDAGIDQRGAEIAVVSDTPCGPVIEHSLRERRARVSMFAHPSIMTGNKWDVIVAAMRPSDKPAMDINCLGRISENSRNALLVQFSGEIDRSAAHYFSLRVWPPKRPARGQLGLPLEALGAAPTIRKLMGGLKAAEAAYRGAELGRDSVGFIVKAGKADQ